MLFPYSLENGTKSESEALKLIKPQRATTWTMPQNHQENHLKAEVSFTSKCILDPFYTNTHIEESFVTNKFQSQSDSSTSRLSIPSLQGAFG